MKVERNINFISDIEENKINDYRNRYYSFIQNMKAGYTGKTNNNSGIVFCPYIPNVFDVSSMYPHIIKVYDETKIRYRTYKRYTPGP